MPPLLFKLVFETMPSRAPALMRPMVKAIAGRALKEFVNPQVKLHMDYQEKELAKTGWFAGPEFTAADVQMSFPVEGAASRMGLAAYPNLKSFLDRIHARPAYQRALERGGPYELLK